VSLFFRSDERRAMHPWDMEGDLSSSTPRNVSPEKAIHLAPVFAAIRHIVDYIATLPIDFYRYGADGSRTRATMPDLVRSISDEVGWETWIGQAVFGLVTVGNAVGKVSRVNGFARPAMIEWAGNWSGGDDGPVVIDGRTVSPASLVHVPWIVPPGKRMGLSPIGHYAAIVRAGLSAQDYADLKRGGGLPPAWLKNKAKELTHNQADTMKARAVSAFATGKPFVHGSDWEFGVVSIPPNHVQFIETMKLSAGQIAAVYGIDPREVGGQSSDSLTYTNDESRALNRAHNLRPYLTRVEWAVDRLLADQTHMKFNIDATFRADMKTRTDVVGAQITDGRMSVNEARALEDRPPVPGGDFFNVPAPKVEKVTREGQL
jgi:phage portal protein BeeE